MNCGLRDGISDAFNRLGSSGDDGLRSRFLISLLPCHKANCRSCNRLSVLYMVHE